MSKMIKEPEKTVAQLVKNIKCLILNITPP